MMLYILKLYDSSQLTWAAFHGEAHQFLISLHLAVVFDYPLLTLDW